MIETIRRAKAAGTMTPAVVMAYAALNLTNDAGVPILPGRHHGVWMQLACDERIDKLLIIAPPESAKTTWILAAFAGCYVGFHPERSVILGSTSGPVAEKRAMSLRMQVESTTWQACFPGVLPVRASDGLKWLTSEWSLAPGGVPRAGRLHPTVSAYGTGGSVIGARADLVIPDDLLDFDNSRTAHQRQLVQRWMHNSLLSRRKSETGRVIMVGTAWHHEDIYAIARKEGGWVVCHTPLLAEGDKFYATVTYPDFWKHEMIGDVVAKAVA